MWTAANTYKTIYMVHTELFGKKSRTFQGLKSFFQGLLFPNKTKHLFWMKIIFIQAAFNNIQRLLSKIQGLLFKDIPLFFNFQGLLKDMTLFQGPREPWIQLILYYCEEDYTVLIRKPQVTFGGGGGDPPAPSSYIRPCKTTHPHIQQNIQQMQRPTWSSVIHEQCQYDISNHLTKNSLVS